MAISDLTAQRGVALLTALLVVALSTVIAVGMVARQQLDVRRTANLLQSEQSWLYHLAVEDHAAPLIDRYWDQIEFLTREEYTVMSALTGFGYQEEIDGGVLGVELVLDLDAQFNPNNLVQDGKVDSANLEIFKRLLQQLEVDILFAERIADWLDPNQELLFDGAEDGFYLGLQRPYRTADSPMLSVSELRLVRGIDGDTFQKLLTWLSPRPGGSTINVNWAERELLLALHSEIGDSEVDAILEKREEGAFKSVAEFNNFIKSLPAAEGVVREVDPKLISVTPRHFTIRTTIELGTASHRIRALLKRDDKGKVDVLLRERVG